MTEIGKPLFFNLDLYYALIEMYIQSDEVECALRLMDDAPEYYKAHPPEKLIKMRDELHRQLWTATQYKGIYDGLEITEEHTAQHWPLHGQVLEDIVKKHEWPHLLEFGPGSYWAPMGLVHKGYQFTYNCLSLDDNKGKYGLEPHADSKAIFYSFETIEHLHNPYELYQNYLKFKRQADIIIISTPTFCFNGGMQEDWRHRPLGHLRTYSPHSFHKIVSQMFHGYSTWTLHTGQTMVLVGER